jgi:hypothetical protein
MPEPSHPTLQIDEGRLLTAIGLLLNEAKGGNGERRAKGREPFFCPVTLTFQRDEHHQFTAFSRDISPSGIGLLHYGAVELGSVVVTISSNSCGVVRIGSHIDWCQPCGEGWYLSGARFRQIISPDGRE